MFFLEKFFNYVQTRPDEVAIQSSFGDLTYTQLDELSSKLALRLDQIQAKTIIPFYLNDTRYVLPVILGIWKSGRTPMPLVSALSLKNALKRVEEVDFDCLLVDFPGKEQNLVKHLVQVDQLKQLDGQTYLPKVQPKYAYILSTSGSTGVPKKVFLTFANLQWILEQLYPLIHVNEQTKFLFSTPYSFDVSLTEILSPIVAGARLVCLPTSPSKSESIRLIPRMIEHNQITHLSLSPSFADALLAISGVQVFSKLKYLMVAGEAFPINLANKLHTALRAGCHVFNLYGPTETTIYATYHELTGREEKVVPIGKPFAGAIAKVVPQSGTDSNKGELYLGGKGVTEGYLLDLPKKEAKFVTEANECYYKTGDQVQVLANGELVFLNRQDDQVQVNGIRVELGEVQTLAEQVPGVKEAVARYVNGRIYVFYLADHDLNEAIAEQLPTYLNPILVKVPQFIYTYNRKLDSNAMIASFYLKDGSQDDSLIKQLTSLLGQFNVKELRDLDSLDLVRFMIEVEDEFNVKIPDEEVASLTTVKRLAAYLKRDIQTQPQAANPAGYLNLLQIMDHFTSEYEAGKIVASSTQQSLFQQGKRSLTRLTIRLEQADLAEFRHLKQILSQLSERIDVLRFCWFKDQTGQLFFKRTKQADPVILAINGQINTEQIEDAMYQQVGRPVFAALVDFANQSLELIFSHHMLDSSSANKLTKIMTDLVQDKITLEQVPISSFADFMNFASKINQDTDLAQGIKLLPHTQHDLHLTRQADTLQVIKFAGSGSTDQIYLRSIWALGKAVIEQRKLAQVTGKIAINLRDFADFNANDVIGDIHATIPFELKASDSLTDLASRYQQFKQLYQTGIDYRFCIFNQVGKNIAKLPALRQLWQGMNLSLNYIGEVKDLEQLLAEIWQLPFKANYITLASHGEDVYAILYGDLFTLPIPQVEMSGQKIRLELQQLSRSKE